MLGERGEKGTNANPKFLLANYFNMSDKTSIDVDGGLSVYKLIEEEADKAVEEISEELSKEIKQEISEGGK